MSANKTVTNQFRNFLHGGKMGNPLLKEYISLSTSDLSFFITVEKKGFIFSYYSEGMVLHTITLHRLMVQFNPSFITFNHFTTMRGGVLRPILSGKRLLVAKTFHIQLFGFEGLVEQLNEQLKSFAD